MNPRDYWEKIDRKTKQNLIAALVVTVLIGFFMMQSETTTPDNSGSASSPSVAAEADTSWIPNEYIQYSDSLAWSFPKQTCTPSFTYCFQYSFISKNGCPSGFYAAINWKDKSEAVVDYTNETLPSLQPLQVAKLTFQFTTPAETSFGGLDVAEIRCY
ncbi:unannotated protein [freshwater metagenome]|uniref:Unannotated protein n=1 Tax=freshwater metagenome TaxID=449393 RepID=A0A6J6UBJ7_9ZZZZ|nr:hypothetical protein [Actinomycetota bacterium]